MSRQLLTFLNGNTRGHLQRFLDDPDFHPRIAWYPSAGWDFRDLLYLHPDFHGGAEIPAEGLPQPPTFFLHTDYFPWSSIPVFDSGETVFKDNHTWIRVEHREELPCCKLPLDDRIVDFKHGSALTHRVFYLELGVHSSVLGRFTRPLIYAFAENAAFCAHVLLPQEAALSHIVRVRFGGGLCGGGRSTGIWLLNVLRKLKCDCLVCNAEWHRQEGDQRIYQLYPELQGAEDDTCLHRLCKLHSHQWSGYGDVHWMVTQNKVGLQQNSQLVPRR
jgi:hypothetical protein